MWMVVLRQFLWILAAGCVHLDWVFWWKSHCDMGSSGRAACKSCRLRWKEEESTVNKGLDEDFNIKSVNILWVSLSPKTKTVWTVISFLLLRSVSEELPSKWEVNWLPTAAGFLFLCLHTYNSIGRSISFYFSQKHLGGNVFQIGTLQLMNMVVNCDQTKIFMAMTLYLIC